MIPTTASALVILVAAVLPGSMYTWAYERQAGDFGVTLADRALRFVAVSLVFDALLAWPAFVVARRWLVGRSFGAGQFALAWLCTLVAIALTSGTGTVIGGLYATRTTREGWSVIRRWLGETGERRLLRVAVGPRAAPRAWDEAFSPRSAMFVRVRTVAGTWLGGRFGQESYAGGFPNDTDLLLEDAWPVDANGAFGPRPFGYALYVPAATIAYVEIVPAHPDRESQDGLRALAALGPRRRRVRWRSPRRRRTGQPPAEADPERVDATRGDTGRDAPGRGGAGGVLADRLAREREPAQVLEVR